MNTLAQANVISAKDRLLLHSVKKAVRGLHPSAEIRLFGSIARGNRREDSDFDILVLTDRPLSVAQEDKVEDALYDVQLAGETLISPLFYSKEEWDAPLTRVLPVHGEVERDGIVL